MEDSINTIKLKSNNDMLLPARYFWLVLLIYGVILLYAKIPGAGLEEKNIFVGLGVRFFVLLIITIGGYIFFNKVRSNVFYQKNIFILKTKIFSILVGFCVTFIALHKIYYFKGENNFLWFYNFHRENSLVMLEYFVLLPLLEVFFFWGLLQNLLTRYLTVKKGVFATSILFAFYAGRISEIPELLVIGLFAGVLFLRTGNIWSVVLYRLSMSLFLPLIYWLTQKFYILVSLHSMLLFLIICGIFCFNIGFKREGGCTTARQKIHWAFWGHVPFIIKGKNTKIMNLFFLLLFMLLIFSLFYLALWLQMEGDFRHFYDFSL